MNSTNNNSFEIAAKKVFSDLYALIKEDEKETEYKIENNKKDNKENIKKDNIKKDNNKKDNKDVISNKKENIKKDKNVISNKIDNKNAISNDKPKPVNLLDLSPDILNIIGDFVKKDNKRREIQELKDEEQIINGIKITFPYFCCFEILKTINTKETLKEYIFNYINREFPFIKKYANICKIRLSKDDKRKCAWVLFKRCKIIIERNIGYYNKDVYNMDDNEEKDFFMEYLKLKNLSLPKNTTFEY
jgi:hypothetical protein